MRTNACHILETDARATVFEEVVVMLRLETFLTVPLLFDADVFVVFFFFAVALAMFLSRQNEWKNLKNFEVYSCVKKWYILATSYAL